MENVLRYSELVPGDVLIWKSTAMRIGTKTRDVLFVIAVFHYDGYVDIVFDKWLTQPLDYSDDATIDMNYWELVR